MRCDKCGGRRRELKQVTLYIVIPDNDDEQVPEAEATDLCDDCVDTIAEEWNKLVGQPRSEPPNAEVD